MVKNKVSCLEEEEEEKDDVGDEDGVRGGPCPTKLSARKLA